MVPSSLGHRQQSPAGRTKKAGLTWHLAIYPHPTARAHISELGSGIERNCENSCEAVRNRENQIG